MTERLINVEKDGKMWVTDNDFTRENGIVVAIMKKLREYETAAEEGRLVITPYKIGKVLFLPRRGEVFPFKVVGTRIYENRTEIDLVYFGNNECYKFLSTHPTTEYIEREYYKTREEAEKALKEMEESNVK